MQMEVSVQMKSRREAIMDTAEKLFNEKGFNRVSLRNISDSLGISKGNLTYYFQKKEDLIEACVLRRRIEPSLFSFFRAEKKQTLLF